MSSKIEIKIKGQSLSLSPLIRILLLQEYKILVLKLNPLEIIKQVTESYGVFFKNELFIRNMYIADYENAGHFNHDSKRDRKYLIK